MLEDGAQAHGWETDLWASKCIAALIEMSSALITHHAIARGFSASLAIARSNPEKELLRKILKRKNAGSMKKLNN